MARAACPVDMTVIHNGDLLSSQAGQTSATSSFGRLDLIGITVIHTGTNRKNGIVLNIDSNGDGSINEIYTSIDNEYKNGVNDYQVIDKQPANIEMEKTSGKSMVLPVMAEKESFAIRGTGGHSRSGKNNEFLPEKKVLYERLVTALILIKVGFIDKEEMIK